MKALSIQQPWAWLILNAGKDIENRRWNTRYRGIFLVHASKQFDSAGYDWVKKNMPEIEMPFFNGWVNEFQRGGVVGAVDLVDTVKASASRWFQGPVGFVLENPKPLPFMPCPGRLSFFNVDYPHAC